VNENAHLLDCVLVIVSFANLHSQSPCNFDSLLLLLSNLSRHTAVSDGAPQRISNHH